MNVYSLSARSGQRVCCADGFYRQYGKRWLDCGLALAGLGVFFPLMMVISLAIVLADGFPVLFRQQRVGRQGRLFTLYKFRTMAVRRVTGSTVTVAGDARVTRFGKILRRLKLDELPQLFNVLIGRMSLVGPRPDVPGYMDKLQGDARALLQLRPGITGPASLVFRNEEALLARVGDPIRYNDQVIFPEKVRLNLEYLRTLSLRRDLACLVQTVWFAKPPPPLTLPAAMPYE